VEQVLELSDEHLDQVAGGMGLLIIPIVKATHPEPMPQLSDMQIA
jgi:hypothetical protein